MAIGEDHNPSHDEASSRREQDLLRELAELGGVKPAPESNPGPDRVELSSESHTGDPPLRVHEEE